jgi:hypothetical protein
MTEPTMPTKKEMLTCAIEKYSCDNCPLENPDCGAITAAIRKLIDAMPEPEIKPLSVTPEEGEKIRAKVRKWDEEHSEKFPAITDEEALLSLRTAACSPQCPGYHRQSCPDCYKGKAMDYLRARLAQKPKVTREQYQKILWYESGDKTHVDRILTILGLEVEDN